MKKGLSAIFIFGLALFLNAPLLAQKGIGTGKSVKAEKVSVRYGNAEAFTDGNGVWLKWQTEVESNNLGFYIYRISGDSTERINNGLVSGGYMRGESKSSGEYSYFDAQGDSVSAYYIQSLDTNGRVVNSRIISPQSIEDLTVVAGVSSASLKKASITANTDSLKSENDLPDDLQSEVNGNAAQADAVTQRWVAAQPGVKIGVNKEGIYRVSRAELQSAGFDVNASAALWQLYVNGVQQSIIVGDGGAYIEFYGRGIDTPEANTQIYYLVVGTQNGKRIGVTVRRPIGGQVLSRNFSQSLTKKERFNYTTFILNGDAENFFGSVINATTATVSFNLPAVDFTSVNASVDIGIQGLTNSSHQTRVVLNGVDIGVVSGTFRNLATRHYDIPTSLLRAGANTLQLTALNGASDVSLFESIKVTYARRYLAEQNQLSFYTTNYRANYLEGFSSPNVRVFDITYLDSPTIVANLPIEQNGGGYRVFLPANRARVMYAVEDSAILQAASVSANTPSSLSTVAHNAELIIISYKDWMTQANDWAYYRRSQGMSVEVVNIEDVFDEFNFGAINSLSIRSFLQYAKSNWQTAPRYVLLIGDATYDPKNYTPGGNFNFVPTKLVDTIEGETASDDALVDFNDDGLAELAIGRSPARSSAEVTQLLNKTKVFEQTSAQGFSRGVIFASDLPNGWDFEGTNKRLRDLLPTGTNSIMVNRGETDAKTRLVNEINKGRFFINYAGHGTTGIWASTDFFSKADAATLSNGNNLSVFTLLTCLNGYFIQPNLVNDSLAEVLLKAQNGGAVAVWASTGSTTPDIQEIMATRFYQQLALGNIKRLGDLVNDAKTVVNAGRDVRLSWALLGDPTLKVR
jgi:hypothetical protein